MKRFFAALLCALLGLGTVPALAEGAAPLPETAESHSAPGAAMPVENGATYRCALLGDGETDWYKLTFPADGRANFWLCCEGPDGAERYRPGQQSGRGRGRPPGPTALQS